MREITEHIVEGSATSELTLRVMDNPGSGGAHHRYEIGGFDTSANPSWNATQHTFQTILFQNGPIKEAGVNGLTHEVLLAIVIDRLRSFQAGPYASAYNAEALEHFELGLSALQRRTRERMARGVEGSHAT